MRPAHAIRVAHAVVAAGIFLAVPSVSASADWAGAAASEAPEVHVSILGGATRFSQPIRSVRELHAMAAANRTQIRRVLAMVGFADAEQAEIIDALTTGSMTHVAIAPGTHMEWMALKRAGAPNVLRNVRWVGHYAFPAYEFTVHSSGRTDTFIVPTVCGNLSLLTTTRHPAVPTHAPPPPPPPPPLEEPHVVLAPPPVWRAPAPTERNRWIASGVVGSSFGLSGDALANRDVGSSVAFGGQIGYLWRNAFGLEFLADFAPDVQIANTAFAENPHVNSYMVNGTAALRLGSEGEFQPYVSGGLGGMALHADVLPIRGLARSATGHADENRSGMNIGGGLMAFAGHVGIRTDVRYYRASSIDADAEVNPQATQAENLTQALLSGLRFWRASAGVAFRW